MPSETKICTKINIRSTIAAAIATFSKNLNLFGVKISGLFHGIVYLMIEWLFKDSHDIPSTMYEACIY